MHFWDTKIMITFLFFYLVTETGFQLHRNINKNDKSTKTTIKVTENLTENIQFFCYYYYYYELFS